MGTDDIMLGGNQGYTSIQELHSPLDAGGHLTQKNKPSYFYLLIYLFFTKKGRFYFREGGGVLGNTPSYISELDATETVLRSGRECT